MIEAFACVAPSLEAPHLLLLLVWEFFSRRRKTSQGRGTSVVRGLSANPRDSPIQSPQGVRIVAQDVSPGAGGVNKGESRRDGTLPPEQLQLCARIALLCDTPTA